MKFTLNGREYEDYQLSNEQIVELIEGDHDVTDMGHEFLMKKVYERFKYELCPKSGEDNDDVFARFLSWLKMPLRVIMTLAISMLVILLR